MTPERHPISSGASSRSAPRAATPERSRAERFIQAFNKVHAELISIGGPGTAQKPLFADALRSAEKQSAVARRFAADLREYADLRNAIVHDYSGLPIAEPHEQTVVALEDIDRLLSDPPKIGSRFRGVEGCRTDEAIGPVVQRMSDLNYYQLPVLDAGTIVGLLTGHTVSRWLAHELARDEFVLAAPVAEVLKHAEEPANWTTMSAEQTIFDAREKFDQQLRAGHELVAILITGNGKPTAKPLGIITLFDYPKLVAR